MEDSAAPTELVRPVLNNLASNCQQKLAEAEHLLGDAVETRRRLLGAEHPNRLASENRLASLPGQCCEAEPLLCEAVAGSKSVLGADHPGTLACVQNLASLLNCQEKLAETETLLRKELET